MISIVGGLFLIIGAYYVFKGDIYKSVIIYFIADICWVMLSIDRGDIFGSIVITIGMILGLFAYIKMNRGVMYKSLKKDNV